MSEQPTTPQTDRAARKLEALWRQAELLERLSQAGERLALTIEAEAAEARAGGLPLREDAAMTFSRVARAVRMSVMLHAKLLRDMDELETRGEAKAREANDAAAEEQDRKDPLYRYKARVEHVVHRVARAHTGDEDEAQRLIDEAGERLDDDDIYGDLLARPIGELVALICRDLDLDPDWTRLAEEAWAKEEIATAPPGSPFLHLPHEVAGFGQSHAIDPDGPLAERSEEPAVEGEGRRTPPTTPDLDSG